MRIRQSVDRLGDKLNIHRPIFIYHNRYPVCITCRTNKHAHKHKDLGSPHDCPIDCCLYLPLTQTYCLFIFHVHDIGTTIRWIEPPAADKLNLNLSSLTCTVSCYVLELLQLNSCHNTLIMWHNMILLAKTSGLVYQVTIKKSLNKATSDLSLTITG